ncbi:MAG: phosphoribosylglycinamide formyltransferase [Alphaproteobacteria bacterium]|nr:phosphoribosylglycinamide formyltransferase [Alphaproteobacteria bacterium]
MARLKLAVLISGRGSNLQALIDACRDPAYPAEIALVVSNEPDALGLERAKSAGLAAHVVNHRGFPDRPAFEAALTALIEKSGAQLVCLAGFMRLLTDGFVTRWRDKLINIHPSLLPAFKGLDTHARAIAAGARVAGCTVHFVRPAMDEGPIIVQAAVPILPGDDPATLAARVLAQEHVIFPAAVRLIAEGRVKIVDERAEIAEGRPLAPDLVNPAF